MARRRRGRGGSPKVRYPLATVMKYGPDDRTVTKIAVAIIPWHDEEESALERWLGADVTTDPRVAEQITQFMASHRVRTVVRAPIVMGCPHEEGKDFQTGGDCPHCPFWKGKQGSGARPDQRWASLDRVEILRFDPRNPPKALW